MPYSSRSRRRMVRKRLGPGGRKAFQSCRNVRRAEGGGSAPALLSWQPFRRSGARLTIHRRNPCPLCRSAPAGSRGGGGNGPVAGRLADAGKGVAFKRRRLGAPGSPTQGQARVGECRKPLSAARVRVAGSGTPCLSDADTIRRSSGLRADCATLCMFFTCTRIPTIFRGVSPRAALRTRSALPNPGALARGVAARCHYVSYGLRNFSSPETTPHRLPPSIAKPAPSPVDFSPGIGGNSSVEEALT